MKILSKNKNIENALLLIEEEYKKELNKLINIKDENEKTYRLWLLNIDTKVIKDIFIQQHNKLVRLRNNIIKKNLYMKNEREYIKQWRKIIK
tara:strand:+ start:205 stop:480 length:276 start_codon:yes stop_codon:yes gene_type:complete